MIHERQKRKTSTVVETAGEAGAHGEELPHAAMGVGVIEDPTTPRGGDLFPVAAVGGRGAGLRVPGGASTVVDSHGLAPVAASGLHAGRAGGSCRAGVGGGNGLAAVGRLGGLGVNARHVDC